VTRLKFKNTYNSLMVDNLNDLNKKLSKDLVDAIGTIDKFINQIENKEVNEDSSQDLFEMFTKFKDELTLIVDLKESEEE
tara:strand:+ start:589 stop:828 length:240 start_codon:yes stop_codon:yes gene_type:complete